MKKLIGLHYISDYADKANKSNTPKLKLCKAMSKIISRLGIDENSSCVRDIKEMNVFCKECLTTEEINKLKSLLMSGKTPEKDYVNSIIEELVLHTKEETEFFDGISEKLGYRQKSYESQKSTQNLGKETLEQQKDVELLDKIEEEERRLCINKNENVKASNNLGEL